MTAETWRQTSQTGAAGEKGGEDTVTPTGWMCEGDPGGSEDEDDKRLPPGWAAVRSWRPNSLADVPGLGGLVITGHGPRLCERLGWCLGCQGQKDTEAGTGGHAAERPELGS